MAQDMNIFHPSSGLQRQVRRELDQIVAETGLGRTRLQAEERRLDRELAEVNQRLNAIDRGDQDHERFIQEGLDLAQWCGQAYRVAPDAMKRMLNQVFFSKVYVVQDDLTGELSCQGVYQQPLDVIFGHSATGRCRRLMLGPRSRAEGMKKEARRLELPVVASLLPPSQVTPSVP